MPQSQADSDQLSRHLEALAEFAAGAGHEINNPVATIVGYVQQLLPGETNPDRRHALLTIGAQAFRIRDMIGDVMLFARPPRPRQDLLMLPDVLRDLAQVLASELSAKNCTLAVEAPGRISIWADPTQLRMVLAILVRNSLEASAEGGSILIRAAQRTGDQALSACPGDVVVLQVIDQGAGLTEQERQHLFDPFFSGRQAGRGLGFGLPKAWRIVSLHGGTIEAHAPPEGGMVVTIKWPALPRQAD